MMGLFFSFSLPCIQSSEIPILLLDPNLAGCFFELSLCCEAIPTVILEVCNPLSLRGAAMGCSCLLCCSASTIPGLQVCSTCSCVHVISQQIQPSFQPKELFAGAFSLQALSGQSVLGRSAMKCHKLTSFQWMLFSCPILSSPVSSAENIMELLNGVGKHLQTHQSPTLSPAPRSSPEQELLSTTVQRVMEIIQKFQWDTIPCTLPMGLRQLQYSVSIIQPKEVRNWVACGFWGEVQCFPVLAQKSCEIPALILFSCLRQLENGLGKRKGWRKNRCSISHRVIE